ncbi:hypothetical protein [Pontibacter vulgaris]|uniref:hypothetical protein n=1 Tax=Pontibacter vulgaris TaxID=2905679 RepID=UPI001FA768E3|nr:hypothetical protein [Pontibacter vulgaris]
MGKRQYRIFRKDIPQHISEILQQTNVQVVLRTKVVVQGTILSLTTEKLELLDGRRNKHELPVNQIEEIIYDKEAAY